MNDFQKLVNAWLDGALTDEQARMLNVCLVQSDQQRRHFANQVQLHHLMREAYVNDDCLATALLRLPPAAKGAGQVRSIWQELPGKSRPSTAALVVLQT